MADRTVPPHDIDDEISRLERRLAELRRSSEPMHRPGRVLNRLTVRKIEADTRPKMHADGGSLYLNRKKSSGPHWVYCFVSPTTGRRRELGIGAFPEIGLAEARRKRDAARAKVRAGIDPIEERNQARLAARLERQKAMTFK